MSPGVPELMNHVEQAESSPHAFTLNRNGRRAGRLSGTGEGPAICSPEMC